jgi:protein-S-isoprenylcysteine O-methyltransferase Ste14
MEAAFYLLFAFLLILFAYIVFRRIVRREYRDRGRLGPLASVAQLLVFLGYYTFPYFFNPPEWPWFWRMSGSASQLSQLIGIVIIGLGMLVAFGTMAWFGIGKAFGVEVEGITRQGPYRISRNPQILGGYLLAIGVFLQWPSLYMAGWVLIYALIAQWMVATEEEHLSRVFGEEYERYCSEVPRYLLRSRK